MQYANLNTLHSTSFWMAAGVGWTSLHLYNYPVNARFLKDITDYVLVHRIVGCCRNWIDILAYTLIYIHTLKHLSLYILASFLDEGINLNQILQYLQELNCNLCMLSYFPNTIKLDWHTCVHTYVFRVLKLNKNHWFFLFNSGIQELDWRNCTNIFFLKMKWCKT